MKKIIIDKKYENKKISQMLMKEFPNLKYGTIAKAFRKKDIMVNNTRINKDIKLNTGDTLTIYIPDNLLNPTNSELEIQCIYQDENILILDKPQGIEVLGNNSLTDWVHKKYGNNCMPCHRLDRNTYGLVIYAKNSETREFLFSKFQSHEIEKFYLAEVIGSLSGNEKNSHYNYKYTINKNDENINATNNQATPFTTKEAYLFKDAKKSKVYISNAPQKGYKKIITSYRTLKYDPNKQISIIEVKLETGRTHQIRAHLAYLGHPIIGDGKYGKNEINKKIHKNKQLLCSYKIKFNFQASSGFLEYLNNKVFLSHFTDIFDF